MQACKSVEGRGFRLLRFVGEVFTCIFCFILLLWQSKAQRHVSDFTCNYGKAALCSFPDYLWAVSTLGLAEKHHMPDTLRARAAYLTLLVKVLIIIKKQHVPARPVEVCWPFQLLFKLSQSPVAFFEIFWEQQSSSGFFSNRICILRLSFSHSTIFI